MTVIATNFHPVHACNDGLFNTASGKQVSILHPKESMICIKDIANALSKLNRFGGHTNRFYSVAQHSVLVACMMPENLKKEGLLHDASEAYLGDVIKPLKVILGDAYKRIEVEFENVIAVKYGLQSSPQVHEIVKEMDMKALGRS